MHPRRKWAVALAVTLLVGIACIFASRMFLSSIPAASQPTPAPAPSPAATVTPAATPAKADDNATSILELFNPSDPSLTHQLNETAITQQIEQIMATSFVLTHCGLFNDAQYRDSFRASIVYAERMKLATNAAAAEARVRRISESAATSYSLLYHRTKCDDPKLATIATQLIDWQNAYLHHGYRSR